MLTLNPAWAEAFAGDVDPVYLVTIELGRKAFLTVLDYTAGAGDFATLALGGVPYTLEEGVDFDAETDEATTAANIVTAFLDLEVEGVNVWVDGDVITATAAAGVTLTLGTSDAAAWAATPAVDDTDSISFVSGQRPLFGYSACVSDVKPIGASFKDPIKRTFERGHAAIVFSDVAEDASGMWRVLTTAYPDLKGKLMTVRLGTSTLDEADFADVGVFRIDWARPRAGNIEVSASDAGGILREQKVTLQVIGVHPLQAIEQILIAAGVPAALYDATTLDPTAYADIGHWCVTRSVAVDVLSITIDVRSGISEPTNAQELINGLVELLDGMFVPNESGVYRFQRYDPTGPALVTLTAADHLQDFQPDTPLPIRNHVSVLGAGREGKKTTLIERHDRNSQHRYATAGGAADVQSEQIDSDWLNGLNQLWPAPTNSIAAATAAPFNATILGAVVAGFSGCQFSAAPTEGPVTPTQGTNLDCSAARPVYLMFFNDDGAVEYMRAEAITVDNTAMTFPQTVARFFIGTIERFFWAKAEFTIVERALFGTTAADWSSLSASPATYVADVTIALDLAIRRLQRQANGVVPVDFLLPFSQYAIQVGDKIALDHTLYLDQGRSGATQAVRFETIQKEPRPLARPPSIQIRALFADLAAGARTLIPTPVIPTIPPVGFPQSFIVDSTGAFIVSDAGAFIRRR